MVRYERTAADVDLSEEAELRRLEAGAPSPPRAPPPPAPRPRSGAGRPAAAPPATLLFQAAATVDAAAGVSGTVRLLTTHVEWSGAGAAPIHIPIAHVKNYQSSKASAKKAKLRVTLKPEAGGKAYVFDLTDEARLERSMNERDALRDALQGQLEATGAISPSSSAAAGSVATQPATQQPAAGSKRKASAMGGGGGSSSGGGGGGGGSSSGGGGAGSSSSGGGGGGSSSADARYGGGDWGEMSAGEREACLDKLRSDRELRSSYEQLVLRTPAVLTPAEFWAQRRASLAVAAQQQGFTSRRPAEEAEAEAAEGLKRKETEAAAAAAAGGGGGKQQVTFKLSAAMKLRIFSEYPGVHKLFLEKVPHAMPERVFWMRYFRSKGAAHSAAAAQQATAADAAARAADANGDAEASDQMFNAAGKRRAVAQARYPDTNLAVEELPHTHHGGGYGLAETAAAVVGASALELRREKQMERTERIKRENDLNHHGRVVVDGAAGTATPAAAAAAAALAKQRGAEARASWVAFPDLHEAAPPTLVQLPAPLSSSGRRFAGAVPAANGGAGAGGGANGGAGAGGANGGSGGGAASDAAAEPVATEAQLLDLNQWLSSTYTPALVLRPLKPPTADAALAVACGVAAPEKPPADDMGGPGLAAGKLPDGLAATITELHERVVECLRYFYSCFPLSQRGARERACRLHEAIRSQHAEIDKLVNALPRDSPALTNAALRRLNPLLEMIRMAVDKFGSDVQPPSRA